MVELDLSVLDITETADHKKQTPDLPKYPTLETESEYTKKQREAYSYYQENIKRAKLKRSEILEQIREKKSPMGILLTAIECISMMTGDETFLKQAQDDLIKSYSDE